MGFCSKSPRKGKQVSRTQTEDSRTVVEGGSLPDLEKPDTCFGRYGKLKKLRGVEDDLPQRWWFASKAVPILAATIGPLANVLSIAAIVTSWRTQLQNNGELPEGADALGVGIRDPHWELILNAFSLAFGFVGNLFLLLNFTEKARYIIALPLSIIFWCFSSGMLFGAVVAVHVYIPPIGPGQTYSQGYWYAVIASALYLIGSLILMINMLGYFLGHYPQHFDLDDSQRNVIMLTMLFFFWLAGGAGVFARVCGFTYADALYFCDVTVLTIGFGDYTATTNVGRGLVLPYTVFGIISLGFVIKSIHKFTVSMSRDKVIKARELHEREWTFSRSVSSETELRYRLGLPPRRKSEARRESAPRKASVVESLRSRRDGLNSLNEYGHFELRGRTITFHEYTVPHRGAGHSRIGRPSRKRSKNHLGRDEKMRPRSVSTSTLTKRGDRRRRLLLLKEEKDRFDAMRQIQQNTATFEQYYSLAISVLAFGILWCIGALIFMTCERREQNIYYFEALYFCYVSLLTIGYGDFSPRSNAGKPFFVLWSLLAIPTMTILISYMGDTIVAAVNRADSANWTILPKDGVWHDFLEKHPRLKAWITKKWDEREGQKRIKRGFMIHNPDVDTEIDIFPDNNSTHPSSSLRPTLEDLAGNTKLTDHELARKLALAIQRTVRDLNAAQPKKYSYEEWVEFTRLIRFSSKSEEELEVEEEEGLVEWDWIGEDSPMLANVSEAEWVLSRLCESLSRYTKKQARQARDGGRTRKRNTGSLSRNQSPDPQERLEKASASGNHRRRGRDEREDAYHHTIKRAYNNISAEPKEGLVHLYPENGSQAVKEWEAMIRRTREEQSIKSEKDE